MWKMTDGRKSQIVLLDERRLDIIIQPKLYSNDLLDLVASHFKLKEKQYFGLGFYDETNHFNWLQGEKRVLDHDFPKKAGLLVLHFAIKFYVDTIGLLRDTQTVELFYLNARQAVFKGQLECDTATVFELAAHVLQATNGDFVSEEDTRQELKKLPVIPTSTLKQHPSIAFCEDKVISYYEKISGTSRGLAIVNYMNIVEKLPTYGIHYYDVKDKKDIPWWLGISPKGIAVYDKNDKTTPRKLFTWKNLENLYYRDKKFSIEVHGPKRIIHTLSSFNPYEDAVREPAESYDDLSTAISDPTTQVSVSRRTFGASNVDVHAWFASTPQLTKCIWSMAVVQHQFYLDRKQSRTHLPAARSMSEIAADLCRSTTSLPGSLGSDLSRSPSSHSLPSLSNSRYDLTIEQSDSLKAERDMYQALRARKEALEETLRKKTEELKLLCLQEGELTGELPKETPLGPGEQPPQFRRRVGTAFSLSVKNVQDSDKLSNELSKLELEVELQGKITSAAQRLASDKTVSKYVRKQRRQSYTKAAAKLKDMEKKLGDMRKQMGKPSTSTSHHTSRALDGMYHVVHSCPNLELDRIIVGYVHDKSANRPNNSCDSSIHSGDSSLASCKDNSCGDISYTESTNSKSSSFNADGYSDELSSVGDCQSPSHTKSFSEDSSSGFQSMGLHDDSSSSIRVTSPGESLSPKHRVPARRKHFIVSRGLQNSRVKELRGDIGTSRSSIKSTRSDPSLAANLAKSESDNDLDLSVTDSNNDGDEYSIGNTTLDAEENEVTEEEKKFSTRVTRRKQTFIMSRGLRKPLHLEEPRHDRLENCWKTFENIFMGEDEVDDRDSNEPQKTSLFRHEDIMNGQHVSRAPHRKDAEMSRKIQELIDGTEISRPLVRSRSFDYTRDMRVNEAIKDKSSPNKDDSVMSSLKSKESTSSFRKPFTFLTKRRDKQKHMKHSVSDTQSFGIYGLASSVAATAFVLDSVSFKGDFTTSTSSAAKFSSQNPKERGLGNEGQNVEVKKKDSDHNSVTTVVKDGDNKNCQSFPRRRSSSFHGKNQQVSSSGVETTV